jgi:sterol desaturase/sphingolipid hydroxylase (fatty acid hydroxylase superfamily)
VGVDTLLAIALGMQVFFFALDLADRHVTRERRYEGESLKPRTVLFIVAVLAVYFAIQYGGFALVPQTDALMLTIGASWGAVLGRSPAPETIGAPWLWIMVAAAFYLSGLWDYLTHRFVSHSRWLFFTHEYHHLPNQVFVAMPGLAARPFAVVTTFPVTVGTIVCTYGILVGLGLPLWNLEPLKILVLVHVFLLTSSHSCCLRRWWWVHRVMQCLALTTPQEHVLHHTVALKGNYGNFTTLWDRLFGTYLDPALTRHQGHALGLGYDQDFLGALTAGRIKLPAHVRAYFQVDRYCNTVMVTHDRPDDRTGEGRNEKAVATGKQQTQTRRHDHAPVGVSSRPIPLARRGNPQV